MASSIVITRGNTWDYVKCSSYDRTRLRTCLSIPHPNARHITSVKKHRWDWVIRYFNGKRYPSGLYDYIDINHEVVDTREPLLKIVDVAQPLGSTLRPYQERAVLKGLLRGGGIVDVATNGGKTVIFGSMIKTLLDNGFEALFNRPIFIIIHRKEIFDQIVKSLTGFYGIDVGIIQATNKAIKFVNVCMVKTLFNMMNGDSEILEMVKGAGAIFVDEAHHAMAKTYQSILSVCGARYRFGFSGSVPEKDTFAGMEMRKFLGARFIRISNSELISMGLSALPTIYVIPIYNDVDILNDVEKQVHAKLSREARELPPKQRELLERRVWAAVFRAVYDKAIVNNVVRNNKIALLTKNARGSVLIVVDSIAHGELLNKQIDGSVFVSGQPDKADIREKAFADFANGTQRVLIATNIVDEGIDIRKINILIFAGGRKSRRQYIQRIGRGLRKKEGENVVQIFDFFDYGHRIIKRHSEKRMALYKKEQFNVEEVYDIRRL
ncbi:MAG TPA: hypothetical protein ENK98_02240 [Epsilonproteobacteria bacterium]|nr:hypothetical protein [Campylobacterota bacterium]